mmetsp:Transcript_24127/g.44831  ORF Transcript_24127/g.44831 Transcript_24127/m.44831 type:complete len:240 (+) Transcript_24127:3184-3903(+)
MQGDPAMGCQCLKKLADQFGVKAADLLRRQVHIPHQKRPPRQVERRAHQRVIHRQEARPVARNPTLVAHCLGQCLTNGDAHILDGVVIVDMQITRTPHGHIDQRMARQLVQHMIKESDACLIVIGPCTIQVQVDRDIRLGGFAGQGGAAHGRPPGLGGHVAPSIGGQPRAAKPRTGGLPMPASPCHLNAIAVLQRCASCPHVSLSRSGANPARHTRSPTRSRCAKSIPNSIRPRAIMTC